jgi:hypothetical protein
LNSIACSMQARAGRFKRAFRPEAATDGSLRDSKPFHPFHCEIPNFEKATIPNLHSLRIP